MTATGGQDITPDDLLDGNKGSVRGADAGAVTAASEFRLTGDPVVFPAKIRA
jgi:hypothetical protein